jgi:HSP20 family protein
MLKEKKSFFQKLAGTITVEDQDDLLQSDEEMFEEELDRSKPIRRSAATASKPKIKKMSYEDDYEIDTNDSSTIDDREDEGELSVDVYQTKNEIVVEAMVAGVKPEDLHLSITRDMITIKGSREDNSQIGDDDYFYRELFWGRFSRTILLPSEILIEESEAIEKHGLLIIRMPKVDKARQTKLKVKSL